MGFLQNFINKQLEKHTRHISEEHLDDLEQQGYDVSEYREALKEKKLAWKRSRAERNNPTDLSKLAPYVQTPRSSETEFFKAVAGRKPWFFKSKWLRKYTEARIAYMQVLAACEDMYSTMTDDSDSYVIGMVAIDPEHICDVAWMQRVKDKLRAMLEGEIPTPADCREVIDMMREVDNPGDWREVRLGASIAEGAVAWCKKDVLFPKNLPKKQLPTDEIIPILCTSWSEKGGITRTMIPSQFYV